MRLLQIFTLLYFRIATPLGHAGNAQGGKDHPLISRFAGSQLDGFQEIGFG